MKTSRGSRAPALREAARELFLEKGYAGTTMELVSRRAGFSKRTVYLYFKNKDDLLLEVASEGLERLRASLDDVDVDALAYEDAIQTIMERYIRFASDDPQYFRFIFQEATQAMISNASEALQDRMANLERACLRVPARLVERGIAEGIVPPVDPQEAAIVFWGTVTGIFLLSVGGSQTVLPDNRLGIIRQALLVLYHGFKNLPGQPRPTGVETT